MKDPHPPVAGLGARLRALPAALLTDFPWTPTRSRLTPFFALTLSGLVAGAIEGWILQRWIFQQDFYQGDAFVWDAIEHFSWIGLAIGLSAGAAISLSRNILARTTLAGMLGIVTVSASVFLYSGGRTIFYWGSNATEAQGTLFPSPQGWGLYLGAAAAAVTAGIAHLTRRCSGKPRVLLLMMALAIPLAFHCRALYWNEWERLHYRDEGLRCMTAADESNAHPWVGTLLGAGLPFLACLFIGLAEPLMRRLRRPFLLPAALAAATLTSIVGLVWASESMPLTPRSQLENLTSTHDPELFVTAHRGETFRLWRVSPGNEAAIPSIRAIREFRIGHGPLRYTTFALSPEVAAAGSEDGRIRLWTLPSFRPLLEIDTQGRSIGVLSLSLDGKYLASCDRSARIRFWELDLDSLDHPPRAIELPSIRDKISGPFYTLAMSPDGSLLATRDKWHGNLVVYDRRKGEAVLKFGGGKSDVLDWVLFSGDGRKLAIYSRKGAVQILDLQRQTTRILETPRGVGHPLAFSPDRRKLAISDQEKVRVVDPSNGATFSTLPAGWTGLAAYSCDGCWLVLQSKDNGLEVWDSPKTPRSGPPAR